MISKRTRAFSLVEVVAAIGVVSFAVLATVGLLSVAAGTNKDARDEGLAARLASNEFERLRALNSNFPSTYVQRAFDSNLADLGQVSGKPSHDAAYLFDINFSPPSAPQGTLVLIDGVVSYPALAPATIQTKRHFTTLMNVPVPTPAPVP